MGTDFEDLLPGLQALADPAQSVDLLALADIVGLSATRCQRVVTQLIGESPKQYQRRTRLQLGAVLLRSTEAPVIDVALAAGFGSHETFTRAFRQRYGQSPRQWRARHQGQLTDGQATLAVSASRCLTLYRRPLTSQPTGSEAMTRVIEIQDLTAVPVLYQTRKVDRSEVAVVLAEVLPAVFEFVMGEGLAPAGHPFVRHVSMSPAFVEIDAGIPLVDAPVSPPPQSTGIILGELPAGPAATTVHRGPYEGLGEAYADVERWIASSGHEANDGPWEVYLTDPGEVPDPADWETAVFWPLAAARGVS